MLDEAISSFGSCVCPSSMGQFKVRQTIRRHTDNTILPYHTAVEISSDKVELVWVT